MIKIYFTVFLIIFLSGCSDEGKIRTEAIRQVTKQLLVAGYPKFGDSIKVVMYSPDNLNYEDRINNCIEIVAYSTEYVKIASTFKDKASFEKLLNKRISELKQKLAQGKLNFYNVSGRAKISSKRIDKWFGGCFTVENGNVIGSAG